MFLNVYKQTFHISHVRISQKSKMCFNTKSSTYYFHMKTELLTDFQICISVPLNKNFTKICVSYSFRFTFLCSLPDIKIAWNLRKSNIIQALLQSSRNMEKSKHQIMSFNCTAFLGQESVQFYISMWKFEPLKLNHSYFLKRFLQKQSPGGVLKKVFLKVYKIHRKAYVFESLF